VSERRDGGPDRIRRQLRVIAILESAEHAGLAPLESGPFHTIAYFADALAPVWGLRILDAQLLKQREGPLSPTFQHDIDRLVGQGVVTPHRITHRLDRDGNWRLDASYSLNSTFATPILEAAASFERFASELAFVREVVYAISGLGELELAEASTSDAAYGSEVVAIGGLLDLSARDERPNPTARVALRFGELLEPDLNLASAEMVHLYVRELYRRLQHAA
jgi:hypothetical protein